MEENRHTANELKMLQALPLDVKIQKTRLRIKEWVDAFGENCVYVSFSGGKDSTVLLDIIRKDYPNVEAVFVNTGLEFPSVRKFALSKENVTELRPKMNFRDVVIKYGYPIFGKQLCKKITEAQRGSIVAKRNFDGSMAGNMFDYTRYSFLLYAPFKVSEKCCDVMKKKPLKKIKKFPIIASMACESINRKKNWFHFGCNGFAMDKPISNPMSFWTEQDVLTYIHENNLEIADAYGQVVVKGTENGQACINDMLEDYRGCEFATTGCNRTGCIFCGFGITQDKNRFIRLAKQEPKLCDYVMRGGGFDECGMWKPTNDGLGYWFVLEWLNVHGNIGIGIPNREHYLKEYGNERTRKCLEV